MALIDLDTEEKELIKFNWFLFHTIAVTTSLIGLLTWSVTPFVARGKSQIWLRYTSLASTLFCGGVTLACGLKLERIKPKYKAITQAEEDSFFHKVASSQFRLNNHFEALAQLPNEYLQAEFNTVQSPNSELTERTPEPIGMTGLNASVTSAPVIEYLASDEISEPEIERTKEGYYQHNIKGKQALCCFVWGEMDRGGNKNWQRASKKIVKIAKNLKLDVDWID